MLRPQMEMLLMLAHLTNRTLVVPEHMDVSIDHLQGLALVSDFWDFEHMRYLDIRWGMSASSFSILFLKPVGFYINTNVLPLLMALLIKVANLQTAPCCTYH